MHEARKRGLQPTWVVTLVSIALQGVREGLRGMEQTITVMSDCALRLLTAAFSAPVIRLDLNK